MLAQERFVDDGILSVPGKARKFPDEDGIKELVSKYRMDTLFAIAGSLGLILEVGGHNFVIFTADAEKNYYIQFSHALGEEKVHAEAVSNHFLAPEFRLDSAQIARLKMMGWHPPEVGPAESGRANFYREWEWTNDDARLRLMALDVMRTFAEVYGYPPDQDISARIKLETW